MISAALTIVCVQESCDPTYVALLAAHTTHRAVLAGDSIKAPALCDHTSDFVEEAVRYIIYLLICCNDLACAENIFGW